ncbi:hypothetical protein [Anoxybacter fermentans]|uniref:hypothetical protein n=1 Tax=Anoxybacter fermentans TaxID=1323375 RepID=UPI0013E094B9|nr:hypothetical protein [Anoxybacter fermentans]
MKGLVIVDNEQEIKKENLYYSAFNTDQQEIEEYGIEKIFGHKYAHIMFYLLNFNLEKQRSNKFHTCTAISDFYTAFFEGFAEHLEIVSIDLGLEGMVKLDGLWDYGLELNAWLSYRDAQLRYFAVKNNCFFYHTALPDIEEYDNYIDLDFSLRRSYSFYLLSYLCS